jgi:hypothetical protein
VTYTISTNNITSGGSISLGTLNINTSGAQEGGNVTIVGNTGTSSTGSVSIGSINTSSSLGVAGGITVIGNGVTIGAINASGNSTGQITPFYIPRIEIHSVQDLSLANTYYVTNGLLATPQQTGINTYGAPYIPQFPLYYPGSGYYSPSTAPVHLSTLSAGTMPTTISGTSISASGLISSSTLTLSASAGDISALNSESNNLIATASGAVTINNLSDFPTSTASVSVAAGTSANAVATGTSSSLLSVDISGTTNNLTINGVANALALGGVYAPNGGTINVVADSLMLSGSIRAGANGVVSIQPVANSTPITIGSGSSGIVISTLTGTTAASLTIGSSNGYGGVTVIGNLSSSSIGNLSILQGAANFTNNGSLQNNGSISINVGGTLTAGSISTTGQNNAISLSGSSIQLSGNISANNGPVALTSLSGGITGSSSNIVSGSSVALSSTGGSIGSFGLSAPVVTVTQTGIGGTTLSDNVAATITATVGTGGLSFTDSGAGGITLSNALNTVGAIQLIDSSTSANASINLGGPLSAASVILQAAGSGGIIQSAGTITAQNVSLSSGSGDILNISTSTPAIYVNTSGNAGISNTGAGPLSLSVGSSIFASFSVSNDNNLTVNSSINSAGTLTLSTTANNGFIQIGTNNVNAANISITTNGSGNVLTTTPGEVGSSKGGGVLTSSGNLNLSTSSGYITVNTSTPDIYVNSSGAIYITNGSSSDLSLSQGSTVSSSLFVTTKGNLNEASPISAVNRQMAELEFFIPQPLTAHTG